MKGEKLGAVCRVCKKACLFDHRPFLNQLVAEGENGEKIILTIQVSIQEKGMDPLLSKKEIVCEDCIERLVIQGVSA